MLEAAMRHYRIAVHPGRREQLICCPVHDETHPSCSVNLAKGVWHCHACQAGGGWVELVMAMEGVNDRQRAKTIAADYGLRGDGTPADGRTVRYQRPGDGLW